MSPPKNSGNNWSEYQKLVLAELERHGSLISDIDGKISDIRVEIAMLKVKSGVWGAAAGLVSVLVFLLYQMLSKNT